MIYLWIKANRYFSHHSSCIWYSSSNLLIPKLISTLLMLCRLSKRVQHIESKVGRRSKIPLGYPFRRPQHPYPLLPYAWHLYLHVPHQSPFSHRFTPSSHTSSPSTSTTISFLPFTSPYSRLIASPLPQSSALISFLHLSHQSLPPPSQARINNRSRESTESWYRSLHKGPKTALRTLYEVINTCRSVTPRYSCHCHSTRTHDTRSLLGPSSTVILRRLELLWSSLGRGIKTTKYKLEV